MAPNNPGTPVGQWIFLQFLVLLVVMVAPLFALFFVTTKSGFRGYVYQGDVNKALAFAPFLEKEFERTQSWEAVEPLLSQAPFSDHAAAGSGDAPSSEVDGSFWDSKHVLAGTSHPAQHVADAVVLTNHEAFLTTTALTLLLLFPVSLGLAVPLAFWLGARIARPLRALGQGTQRAALGDWNWNLPAGASRKVWDLSEAFQTLGQNLRLREHRKAQLLADAAHELRTPLTVVRGTLEAMLDGVFPLETQTLTAVFAETVRLEKIVESLRQREDLHTQGFPAVAFDWCELVPRRGGGNSPWLWPAIPGCPVPANPRESRRSSSICCLALSGLPGGAEPSVSRTMDRGFRWRRGRGSSNALSGSIPPVPARPADEGWDWPS